MEDKTKKLKILLKHLINHNEDHAKELEELVATAKSLGNEESYKYMKKGVEELKQSNKSLEKAYKVL